VHRLKGDGSTQMGRSKKILAEHVSRATAEESPRPLLGMEIEFEWQVAPDGKVTRTVGTLGPPMLAEYWASALGLEEKNGWRRAPWAKNRPAGSASPMPSLRAPHSWNLREVLECSSCGGLFERGFVYREKFLPTVLLLPERPGGNARSAGRQSRRGNCPTVQVPLDPVLRGRR
jgi:hypothetical protein